MKKCLNDRREEASDDLPATPVVGASVHQGVWCSTRQQVVFLPDCILIIFEIYVKSPVIATIVSSIQMCSVHCVGLNKYLNT